MQRVVCCESCYVNIEVTNFIVDVEVFSFCSCPQLPSLWMSIGKQHGRKLLSVASPGFTGWPPAGYREEIPATELSPPTVVCFAGIWLCWRDGRQMELVWEEKKIGFVKWNRNRRPTPVRRRFYEERRETVSFLPPRPYGKQHVWRAKDNTSSKRHCWVKCSSVMREHISSF